MVRWAPSGIEYAIVSDSLKPTIFRNTLLTLYNAVCAKLRIQRVCRPLTLNPTRRVGG